MADELHPFGRHGIFHDLHPAAAGSVAAAHRQGCQLYSAGHLQGDTGNQGCGEHVGNVVLRQRVEHRYANDHASALGQAQGFVR